MTKQNKIYTLSDEEFIKLVKSSISYRQISIAAGCSAQGRYSYDLIKRRISELGLSTDHFKRVGNGSSPKYSLEKILVENSSYLNLTRLKNVYQILNYQSINVKYVEMQEYGKEKNLYYNLTI